MRSLVRSATEILITVVVVVLGFVAYLYWGTAAREAGAQRVLAGELRRQWTAPDQSLAILTSQSDLALGKPFALLSIPRFGAHRKVAVVQGTTPAELSLGPGHVPGTALPGMLGNFAVAGHRVTAGSPFRYVPDLRPGDLIDIETGAGTYQYVVTGRPAEVSSTDSAALAPVPGQPGVAPRRRMITLITSDPPWTGTSRIIVTGVLVRLLPRAQESGG
jgi:sortase A